MKLVLMTPALLCGTLALAACQAQTEDAARDVINMEQDAQAVPNQDPMANVSGNGAASAAPISILNADGRGAGTVAVSQDGTGIRLIVAAENLPPGVHGMHIHEAAACDLPAFASAGGHWNPTSRQHGTENPQGAHTGDLPNLTVGPDGRGSADVRLPNVKLTGGEVSLADANGSALVIHAQPDDNRTDPSGNSGDRIACAVLTA